MGKYLLMGLVVVGFLFASESDYGQAMTPKPVEPNPLQGTWSALASLPMPKYYHSVAGVIEMGGKHYFYSLGGGLSTESDNFEYCIEDDVWATKSTMPVPLGRFAAAACKGKIYFFGGYPGVNGTYEYDPVNDTYTTKANMPMSLSFHTAETWRDTLIYILGGESPYQNAVWVYDPTNDTWNSGTSFGEARRSHASACLGDTLYVFEGWAGYFINSLEAGVIDPNDPQTIAWSTGPTHPHASSRLTGDEVPDRHVIVSSCGNSPSPSHHPYVYSYAPGAASWLQEPDRPEVGDNCDAAIGYRDKLYHAGGFNGSGASAGHYVLDRPGFVAEGNTEISRFQISVPSVSKGMLAVNLSTRTSVELSIYDVLGKVIKRTEVNKPVVIDLTNVASGVYFLEANNGTMTTTSKFMIVR